ncbi:unnamed protein product [Paramecium primaurelia]|uniref:Uncharacterized protein n=1 Tax=Paramecium primaurelia TaxID=5886 RepID=A0A8S1K4R6_PARPR|nr:unnamed protein product [Paramecium primaurelia]
MKECKQVNKKFKFQARNVEKIRILKRDEGFGDRALLENVPTALTALNKRKEKFNIHQIPCLRRLFIQIIRTFSLYFQYVEQFQKNFILTVDRLPKRSFYLIQYGDILIEKFDKYIKQLRDNCLEKKQFQMKMVVVNITQLFYLMKLMLRSFKKHEFLKSFQKNVLKKKFIQKNILSINMESLFGIGKPKFIAVKQFIYIKNNPIKINSKYYEDKVKI